MLLTQLTALRDEQPALLSCLAFDRTLSYGVDLARRSLADLFAGFSTVRPFVMRAFFFRLQTEIFSRLCSLGYVQNHARGIYPGHYPTKNFRKFCRTFVPVSGTSVSSVRPVSYTHLTLPTILLV